MRSTGGVSYPPTTERTSPHPHRSSTHPLKSLPPVYNAIPRSRQACGGGSSLFMPIGPKRLRWRMANLTSSQYEALLNLALLADRGQAEEIRKDVDAANGITRHYLSIRWQTTNGARPRRMELAAGWPPEQTHSFVSTTPFSDDDITAFFEANSVSAANVHVTKDPKGTLGWYTRESYPW